MYLSRFTAAALGLLTVGTVGLISGCGSGPDINGRNQAQVQATPSPIATPSVTRFAGIWSGPFVLSTGQTGITEVTITDAGNISGLSVATDDDSVVGAQGPAEGVIEGSGDTTINFSYRGSRFSGSGNLQIITTNGVEQIRGRLTQTVNGVSRGTVDVTLSRGPLPRS